MVEGPELIVFDMAGTTVQVTNFVPDVFREAFRLMSIELSDQEISLVRGKSKREAILDLLQRHLGKEKGRQTLDTVFDHFQNTLLGRFENENVTPIPGAETVFRQFRENGIKTALTTGFSQRITEILLEKLGWNNAVDVWVSQDQVISGRPAPYLIFHAMEKARCHSVHRTAVVGDTISDLQSARNAGAGWSFGVLSGAHNRQQLQSRPHTAILNSVGELPAYLADPSAFS
jgi:phosphonatase-like hydrolase